MAEFIKSECPHCGQPVESSSESTGQTVLCPTCAQNFVLTPSQPSEPIISPPPLPSVPPTAHHKAATPTPSAPPPAPESRRRFFGWARLWAARVPAPAPRPASPTPLAPTPPLPPVPLFASQTPPPAPSPESNAPSPPAPALQPAALIPAPKPRPLPPLDQAVAEFEHDQAFAGRVPTREQVARAWALARYKSENELNKPSHPEVVVALKKLFPAFRNSKPVLSHSRTTNHSRPSK